jgi:hypothetical protein
LDVDKISKLARARHLQDPLFNIETFRRYLTVWFCFKFNRPMKDPLLAEYTTEELAYEFFVHYYIDPANDPAKEAERSKAEQSDMDWAKKMLEKLPKPPEPPKPPEKEPETPPVPDLPELSTSFEG